MASSSKDPLSLLYNWKEQLSCALCLELLDEPKSLSCTHTFCEKCLGGLVRNRGAAAAGNIINCPLCRESVVIPFNGFKTNSTIKGRQNGLEGWEYWMVHREDCVSEMVSNLKGMKLPEPEAAPKCSTCLKLTRREELYVCTDPCHLQGESSESTDGCVKIVLCCHCVLASHRTHETRNYLELITGECRAEASMQAEIMRESIVVKLRAATDCILDKLMEVSQISTDLSSIHLTEKVLRYLTSPKWTLSC